MLNGANLFNNINKKIGQMKKVRVNVKKVRVNVRKVRV